MITTTKVAATVAAYAGPAVGLGYVAAPEGMWGTVLVWAWPILFLVTVALMFAFMVSAVVFSGALVWSFEAMLRRITQWWSRL